VDAREAAAAETGREVFEPSDLDAESSAHEVLDGGASVGSLAHSLGSWRRFQPKNR
jgi:hypothetical protein